MFFYHYHSLIIIVAPHLLYFIGPKNTVRLVGFIEVYFAYSKIYPYYVYSYMNFNMYTAI